MKYLAIFCFVNICSVGWSLDAPKETVETKFLKAANTFSVVEFFEYLKGVEESSKFDVRASSLFRGHFQKAMAQDDASKQWLIETCIENQSILLYGVIRKMGIKFPEKEPGSFPANAQELEAEFAKISHQELKLTQRAPTLSPDLDMAFFPFRLKLLGGDPKKIDSKSREILREIQSSGSELEKVHAAVLLARCGDFNSKNLVLDWSKNHSNGYVRFLCRDQIPDLFSGNPSEAMQILNDSKNDTIRVVISDQSLGNGVDNAIFRLNSNVKK